MDLVIESGAIDYTEEEEFFEVITDANNFNDVLEIFKKNEIEHINAQLSLRAETSVDIDHEMSEKVLNIMQFMDDLDDVQEVHTNAEFPDDFEAKDN
jgi:transcriptional/translational regulatory protein YebC/TACO1